MWKTRGKQLTPYLFDNYRYRNVYTDADGNGFIIQGHGLFKAVRIKHVRGTIYRHIAHESGQPFSIRALDGKAVLRDRGLLKTSFLVDTKGDQELENDRGLRAQLPLAEGRGSPPRFLPRGRRVLRLNRGGNAVVGRGRPAF